MASVGAALLGSVGAETARAALVTVTPTVQGAGSVTAGDYACSNSMLTNTAVVTCPATSHDTGFFGGAATVSLQATPKSGGGWVFAGWDNCPSGPSSNPCVLTAAVFDFTATFAPRAHFRDFTGPAVTSITPVYSTSTDRGVSFIVAANETATGYECQVDTGPLQSCAAVRQLPEGSHSVRARATDPAGNLGSFSAPTTFRIVDTQLVDGPADFSNVKRPTFTYATVAGLTFQCSIDSVVVTTPCGTKDSAGRASFTPPADLADGVHTFRVRAVDGPDYDRVPIVRTWTVDSTPPDTTLAAPDLPEGVLTTLVNATFTYTSTEPTGATFECRLDTAAYGPCTSPSTLTNLPFGGHAFQVRAIDRAGNVDPSPATRNWEIAARDNDGDGFNQRSDCNDGDPRINPSAADAPGNGVDENCDGADSSSPPATSSTGGSSTPVAVTRSTASATPLVPAVVGAKGTAAGARIVFTRLSATRVPLGATITASCSPKQRGACPFRTKRTTAKKATVNLIAAFAKRRQGKPDKSLAFRAPAVLTITVSKSGMAPRSIRFSVAKGKFPKGRVL